MEYAEDNGDPALLSKAYMQLGKIYINSDPDKTIKFFNNALDQNSRINDSLMDAKIHHNLGVVYGEILKQKDSALYHYDIALKQYQKENLEDYISYIFNNKASLYRNLGDYDAAIAWYQKTDSLEMRQYELGTRQFLYKNMAETYELNQDYENALRYRKLENSYRDSINQAEQDKALLDVNTKYQVEKKENENLKLKQHQTILWILSGILLLLFLIAYLAYRNAQSRKKLLVKDHEIEKERLEKSLKDQQLSGLDAMIEGQEKERQRIANDLHDNLGSLLATLKLHFQNLKVRKDRLKEEEDRLMKQTDELLDEAYQEVRKIAHVKNAGMKGQEGLVPAIMNFASKVSASSKLIIEVEDHGMDERMENSLEIMIFRFIQELVTNIIKHAEASRAIIYLTHHGDSLNIMVEDDGKGFERNQIKPKDGMGIHSIQKRVELQEGTVDIESVPGKGTTVIINIPIQ
ncbi:MULTISPECIES: tetratricopeptide repeat-containing sensor histidine kinase [Christiangramia]|uniref:tetratricopeptide repeat-containing sensor histidine kinase n=1 Tax=Christiangramia TaxID=292691 RepID=UPI00111C65C5|nr:sensor histidine kinase [Christiangramia flava]